MLSNSNNSINNSVNNKQNSASLNNNGGADSLSSSLEKQLKTIQVLGWCLQGKSKQSKKVSFNPKPHSISDNSKDQNKAKQVKKISFNDATSEDLQQQRQQQQEQEELSVLNNNGRVLKSCLKVKTNNGQRIKPRKQKKRVSFNNNKEVALFDKELSLEEQQQFEKNFETLALDGQEQRRRFARLCRLLEKIHF